jgi:hypothetical protein
MHAVREVGAASLAENPADRGRRIIIRQKRVLEIRVVFQVADIVGRKCNPVFAIIHVGFGALALTSSFALSFGYDTVHPLVQRRPHEAGYRNHVPWTQHPEVDEGPGCAPAIVAVVDAVDGRGDAAFACAFMSRGEDGSFWESGDGHFVADCTAVAAAVEVYCFVREICHFVSVWAILKS